MKESLELSVILPVTSENLYKAWLDSEAHSEFTESIAEIDPAINGKFSAWEGYITGTNVAFEPYQKIVQAWRTTEFDDNDEDSKLELIFEKMNNETKLTLIHSNIPEGQSEEYKEGWLDFYFKPMQKYFKKK
jgi:activator of HSP90 ATPase